MVGRDGIYRQMLKAGLFSSTLTSGIIQRTSRQLRTSSIISTILRTFSRFTNGRPTFANLVTRAWGVLNAIYSLFSNFSTVRALKVFRYFIRQLFTGTSRLSNRLNRGLTLL